MDEVDARLMLKHGEQDVGLDREKQGSQKQGQMRQTEDVQLTMTIAPARSPASDAYA